MENNEEPRIVTFKEFVEKELEPEELMTIALKCKNCGHRDLLKNFIRRIIREPYPYDEWKPKDYPYKTPPYEWVHSSKRKIINVVFAHEPYEDLFYCPKCGSSLVVLDEEFIKNNVVKFLE